METPDFTGLHGKKLINSHKAWEKRALKTGMPLEKVQYAGLTTDQAAQMYQYNVRVLNTTLLILILLAFLFYGGATVFMWGADKYSPYRLTGNAVILCGMLIDIALYVFNLMRVRNATSARRSYIHQTDERLQSIRRRSGVLPLSYMSLLLFLAGGIALTLSPVATTWDITPPVAAGLALCIAGIVQFLIAVTTYLIMRRR